MGLAVEEATEAVEAETADRFSKLFSSPMHIFENKLTSSHGLIIRLVSQDVAMAAVSGGGY